LFEGVPDVLGDHRPLPPEQLGHLRLGQPDRVALQTHLDPHLSIRCLVEDDLATGSARCQTALPMNFSASFTRNSPEISLGNSASRRAASVRDSRRAALARAKCGLTK